MKVKRVASYLVLGMFTIAMGFALFYLVSLSLQSDVEASSIPPTLVSGALRFQNYLEALNRAPLLFYLRNSFIYTVTTTLAVLFTAPLAGYALTKLKFPGRNLCTTLLLLMIFLPPTVRIVPLYTLVTKLGWAGTWQGLIFPLTMTGFSVFFMRQYLVQIPNTPIEAARIDGASELRIFLQIVLPLCKPALGTIALLNFVFRWNDFLWPLVVTHEEQMPLSVGVALFQTSEEMASWNVVAAAAMFLFLPSFILFLFLHKYIVRGIALGYGT